MPRRSRSYTVVVGTPVVVDMLPFDFECTVTACPAATGSMLVEYSTTPRAAGNPAAANWMNWPAGSVTANTSDTVDSPITAVRATATTVNGTLEIVG